MKKSVIWELKAMQPLHKLQFGSKHLRLFDFPDNDLVTIGIFLPCRGLDPGQSHFCKQ